MRLKLPKMIATRPEVRELAARNPEDVTELDFEGTKVYGASAMHQLILSFPNATFLNMESFVEKEYVWVQEQMKRIAERAQRLTNTDSGGDS